MLPIGMGVFMLSYWVDKVDRHGCPTPCAFGVIPQWHCLTVVVTRPAILLYICCCVDAVPHLAVPRKTASCGRDAGAVHVGHDANRPGAAPVHRTVDALGVVPAVCRAGHGYGGGLCVGAWAVLASVGLHHWPLLLSPLALPALCGMCVQWCATGLISAAGAGSASTFVEEWKLKARFVCLPQSRERCLCRDRRPHRRERGFTTRDGLFPSVISCHCVTPARSTCSASSHACSGRTRSCSRACCF